MRSRESDTKGTGAPERLTEAQFCSSQGRRSRTWIRMPSLSSRRSHCERTMTNPPSGGILPSSCRGSIKATHSRREVYSMLVQRIEIR